MITEINNKIISYLSQYEPSKIGIFGSYARGDDSEASDIDILVNFNGKITLFDLSGIKQDLADLLNRRVDIVTERSINKRVKNYIYKDLKIIYG